MARNTIDRTLFRAREPERVRRALRQLKDGRLLASLENPLELALRGSDDATREYVRRYRELTTCLLVNAHRIDQGRVVVTDQGEMALVDANGEPARAPIGALENGAAEAPFTPWVARYELADAVGLDLTSRVRVLLGHRALNPPATDNGWAPVGDDLDAQRFIRRVRHYLNHPEARHPLHRIADAFALSKTELGGLFGVRRQAVDQWLARGVPPERQEKIATLDALVDVLERKLKPGRLPGVARRPAAAYGGETMLDLIRQNRQRELLDLVHASFDWATAA
jgi:hypothetical protein